MSAEATRHRLVESGLSARVFPCLLSQLRVLDRAGQDRTGSTMTVTLCLAVPCVTSLLTFNVFVFGVTSDMLCATLAEPAALIPATNC